MTVRWAGVGMVAWLAACHGGGQPDSEASQAAPEQAAPVAVDTVEARAGTRDLQATWIGSLAADQLAKVAADANGVVEGLRFERGQRVGAGATLATIDGSLLAAGRQATQAQLGLADAQRGAAQEECDRLSGLAAQGVIPDADRARAEAQCRVAAQQVNAVRAQIGVTDRQLGKTRVRAPFTGVIAERLVEVGEFVGAASPIAILVDADPIRVKFAVPERELAGLAEGGKVVIRAATAPDRTFEGTLQAFPPMAREMTRDLLLEAVVANADGALKPGGTASVEVVAGKADAVFVPRSAVVSDDTVHRVFTVSDGHAVEHFVHLEATVGEDVAVSPGIRAGDAVIVAPPAGLRDGAAVE